MFEYLPQLEGKATVELIVNGSTIVIEVDGINAPVTAGNFVDLVERGVYDNVPFHRVVKEPTPFVVQGGDPQGQDPNFPINQLGTGGFIDPETGQERTIPLEIKLEGDTEPTYSNELGRNAGNPPPNVVLGHDRGVISMARSSDPDSASSQFFLTLDDVDFLDGDYAVFGTVVEGLDVIDNIAQGDRITDAQVTQGLGNLIPGEDDSDDGDINLYRFRNKTLSSGTYLFVGERERDNILNDVNLNQSFEFEGDNNAAFTAAIATPDNLLDSDLIPFYRLQSLEVPGTYLFVGNTEYNAIFDPLSDQNNKWTREGLNTEGNDIPEFYLYGVGTGKGTEFHRFQNTENNTFLFAGPKETADINQDPNLSNIFIDQGVAFESL